MNLGYLAIILGFAALVVLSLCNVSVFMSSVVASIIVIALGGLPFTTSFTEYYFPRLGTFLASMLPIFLFGAALATIYVSSGAAECIADSICNALFKAVKNERGRVAFGIMSVILSSAVLCFGGINATVAIITIYPIAVSIFERAAIPRRFVIGAICSGTFTFALSGPGSPQPTNLVGVTLLNSPATAGLVAGIIGALVEIIVSVLLMTRLCMKAKAKGEVFAYGANETRFNPENRKRPSLICSLIPLVFLVVVFNVFSLHIFPSAMMTCILAVILLRKNLTKEEIAHAFNQAGADSVVPAATIGAINGFAAIVQTLPEYQKVIDGMLALEAPPALLLIVVVAFICCMTGGSTTGSTLAFPVLAPVLTAQGLSMAFVHRVGCFAATTIDSLPHSASVIMAADVGKLKMREAYPAVFATTVVATICGTIAVAVVMSLFPFLP